MVFVRVRETFDLHTVKDKMTLIGIHTPKASLIAKNFPGLLMQCKAYRCVSADVTVACASMLPADPLQVSTTEGDIAPEDLFNPILYKATTNLGLSQIEARIQGLGSSANPSTVNGDTAQTVNTGISDGVDFNIYYGLLADAHGWKHANPQAGLEMKNLKPLVYEMLYNVGDNNPTTGNAGGTTDTIAFPAGDGSMGGVGYVKGIRGNAKPIPFINCTSYSVGDSYSGFNDAPQNHELNIPWINCVVGAILVPPSRLHELFYRMVVEWTIEFSQIRPVGEVTNWTGLAGIGNATHYQDYSYSATKKALTGSDESVMSEDTTMVSTTVPIEKVF